MGKSKDADVVLWGWYRVGPLPDSVRATVQFEIVGDPKELKIPQRREDIYSTSTPRTFAWRLADEVQHVVLATLGYAHFNRGAISDAIRFYEKAIKSQRPEGVPNTLYFPHHFLKGIALQKKGKFAKSITSYDRALEIDSTHALAWNNLGVSQSEQGKLEKAITSYDRALEIDSTHALAWTNRGIAQSEQGKLDEAIRSYNRALEIDSTHAMAWTNRGIALSEQGKLEEAIESYSRALEIDSSLAGAWAHRGLVLYEIGKKGAAVQNVDRACKLERTYCGPYPWEN
jgi:tetratricopeptide (TPR) repeat protein